jgi:hypothetical protein
MRTAVDRWRHRVTRPRLYLAPWEQETGSPRPMQACTCSLAGAPLPGMRIPWIPFHEMTATDPRTTRGGRRAPE